MAFLVRFHPWEPMRSIQLAMSRLGPHLVLVARLSARGDPGEDGPRWSPDQVRRHHALLEQCSSASFGAVPGTPHSFAHCDETAVLLCDAGALPAAIGAALSFIEALRQPSHDDLRTQLGLADGIEHWDPGSPWTPGVFGSGISTSLALATMARPGQLLAPGRLVELLAADASIDVECGPPLEVRLWAEASPIAVAGVGTPGMVAPVWNLEELVSDLTDLAKITGDTLQVLETLPRFGERLRLTGDTSTLASLESKLLHLTSPLIPGPLFLIRQHVEESSQLRRLSAALATLNRLEALAKAMTDAAAASRPDVFQPIESPEFKRAVHALLAPTSELISAAWALQKNTLYWLRSPADLDAAMALAG